LGGEGRGGEGRGEEVEDKGGEGLFEVEGWERKEM